MEPPLIIGGLIVGFLVGLTGMGGGALMTPMLVFFFHVNPLTAISSDIVVSLFMKPAGAAVHIRRKTVDWTLVKWLCIGSVPAAFVGAIIIQAFFHGDGIEDQLKKFLGGALLIATAGLIIRAVHGMLRRATPLGEGPAAPSRPKGVVVKPLPTIILGAVAGLMVGITSVGAGSIVIVALLLMYPALKASQLVGTDLVQAIPLVGAAALGHLFFGDFNVSVAGSLLIGAIPGAWAGAQVSSRAPGGIIRRILAVLLLASGLKLLGVSNNWVLIASGTALVAGNIAWILLRNKVTARVAVRTATAHKASSASPDTNVSNEAEEDEKRSSRSVS